MKFHFSVDNLWAVLDQPALKTPQHPLCHVSVNENLLDF